MLELIPVSAVSAGAVGAAAIGFSARFAWWRRVLPGTPVLQYRHVGEAPAGHPGVDGWIRPAKFARQLDWLLKKGYNPVTAGQSLSPHCPPRPVVITFDVGFDDFYYNAWPLLAARNMAATVFLAPGLMAREGNTYPTMTRSQVLELARHGVEIGGSGQNFKDLTKLDEKTLRREVTGCQKVLNDMLGRPSRAFAYPYGRINEKSRAAVERAGFTRAFTCRPGKLTAFAPALASPRITIANSDSRLDLWLKLSRGRSRLWGGKH